MIGYLLFALAAAATLGIFSRDPFVALGYETGVLLLAAYCFVTRSELLHPWMPAILGSISLWGFAQLGLGATENRWNTFGAALRFASYGATWAAAHDAFRRSQTRERFLKSLAWFGFALSIISVLTYFSSPDKILWLVASPYPDTWGPFLSRNNFAQFLELTLPAALWLALQAERLYLWMAAAMLAAGVASASRAGAILLAGEAVVIFLMARRRARRNLTGFLPIATLFIGVVGAGTLLGRLTEEDPLAVRHEIYHSSMRMIGQRPFAGYGLGTYAAVYPEFAEFDTGKVVEHAHSDWLEWASEGGIGFVGAWFLLILLLWRPALCSIWGLGVVAVFLHALVDNPFARHGVAAWVFMLAGALGRNGRITKRSRNMPPNTGTNRKEFL